MGDPVSISIMAIAAGFQAAQGIGQAISGKMQEKKSEKDFEKARATLSGVRYGDATSDYFRSLQGRVNVGLPSESRVYAEQQADRAMASAIYGAERSGLGLAGIGASQQSASDQYRKIAAMDAEMRLQNLQAMQAEMAKRGQMRYSEDMSLANLDLAQARALRQEAIQKQQAGMQTAVSGVANFANTAIFAEQNGLWNLGRFARNKNMSGFMSDAVTGRTVKAPTGLQEETGFKFPG